MFARDFRSIARQALTGRWGVAIGTALVAGLLGGESSSGGSGGSGARFSRTDWQDTQNLFSSNMSSTFYYIIFGVLGIAILWALVCFFIGGAIRLGYVRFNKNLISGYDVRFHDLFSRFNLFWKGFVMQFLMGLYTFLWTLLFIIPGIIAAYSYAMTPYILEENPYMTANEAIYHSKEMMRGKKWRLFCLNISFIGWILLCLFTCGIGFLWLSPYMAAAEAAFYFEVSGKFNNQGNQQYYQGSSNQQYYQNPNNQQYYQNSSNQQYYQNSSNQQYNQYPNTQQYNSDPNRNSNNQQYYQDLNNQLDNQDSTKQTDNHDANNQ